MITLAKIKEVVDRIVKNYQPDRVILFGSYAWGAPTKDSDVDLFIVKNSKGDMLEEHKKVRRIIDGEIASDILIYSEDEVKKRLALGDFFFNKILNKGSYLYGHPTI